MACRWTHGGVPSDIAFWGKHSARQETEISFLVWNNLENPISVALGPADGTRPQPMPTEIKTTLLRLAIYLSGRDWNTGWSRGVKKNLCRTLRDFRASLERRLIAVNRDSYVVLASLSTDVPSKN